jgi:excisionase family DNA binding protein
MSEIKLQVSNLIDYRQAARMLGVSRQTVHAMIKRGELHPFSIADRRFLFKEEVERLVKSKKAAVGQTAA